MGTNVPLPCSQAFITGLHPEWDQFSPHPPILFLYILILSSHLYLVITSGHMYAFLFYPFHVTYPTDLTLLDMIIVIIYGEDYKSLCNFRHPQLTCSPIWYIHSRNTLYYKLQNMFMSDLNSVNSFLNIKANLNILSLKLKHKITTSNP